MGKPDAEGEGRGPARGLWDEEPAPDLGPDVDAVPVGAGPAVKTRKALPASAASNGRHDPSALRAGTGDDGVRPEDGDERDADSTMAVPSPFMDADGSVRRRRPAEPARPATPSGRLPAPSGSPATRPTTPRPDPRTAPAPAGPASRPPPQALAPGPPRPDGARPAPSGRAAPPPGRNRPPRWSRPPRWRGRVLPKSVLGISMLILAFSVGAAASGVGLYMYYQYRIDNSERAIKNFKSTFADAKTTIRNESVNARAQIQAELEPLRKIAATGDTLQSLLAQAQPSVWAVDTRDTAGAPLVGSAFVVASDAEKSFLVTSYAVVQAATVQPGPEITVRKGNQALKATLWTWQESKDLALLIIDKGKMPRLDWADASSVRLGDRVFAVSGLGTSGGAITQGYVADVSKTGIQHDASVGTSFQGGPVIDSAGKVVAVASRAYAPLGFTSDGVYFGAPIAAACEKVLSCPGGQVSGAGSPASTK